MLYELIPAAPPRSPSLSADTDLYGGAPGLACILLNGFLVADFSATSAFSMVRRFRSSRFMLLSSTISADLHAHAPLPQGGQAVSYQPILFCSSA